MITQSELKTILRYDEKSGIFYWLPRSSWNRSDLVGKSAGTKYYDGYIRIWVGTDRYFAHRLAWLYVHGIMPKLQIDHINRCRDDNRIANLREATRSQNKYNSKIPSHNKSGFKGVILRPSGKWEAFIKHECKRKFLGLFDTRKSAAMAYAVASRNLHKEFSNIT